MKSFEFPELDGADLWLVNLTNDGASDGLFWLKSFTFQTEKNLLTEFIDQSR
jgi:hypothetical protein